MASIKHEPVTGCREKTPAGSRGRDHGQGGEAPLI